VPARLFKPAGFKKGGPAVVFVHGSGYLQNVDRKWSTYYHEYLFHHILMERGFLVIDVDYRGSAATAATGAPPSTSTWAARTWTTSWMPPGTWWRSTASTPRRSACTAAATAASSP
jgi:hypothetical protein